MNLNLFKLPYQPYGSGDTERAIEIPWTLACISESDQRVLDVGYAFAEDRYLKELVNLNIPELYGVDYVLTEDGYPKIIKKQADLKISSGFPAEFFDLILAVSVIEHIGHNNDIYFKEAEFQKDFDGDINALRNLTFSLKKGGKVAITVPYGRKVDYGWFVHYDRDFLQRLINSSGCELLKKDLFIYKNGGWFYSTEEELEDIEYKSNEAPAAAGLACILIRKQ